jgi:GNAT superfamily N-acetyltransferase
VRTEIVTRRDLPEAALELMIAAFPEDRPEAVHEFWAGAGSVHAVVYDGDRLTGHAGYVERVLYTGERAITTAYVEYVCAQPQHSGYGSAAMRALAEEIARRGYQLAALATGVPEFYQRLGWRLWRGPTAFRAPDGSVVPTPDEKPMVLDLGANIDLDGPIECDAREVGDVW